MHHKLYILPVGTVLKTRSGVLFYVIKSRRVCNYTLLLNLVRAKVHVGPCVIHSPFISGGENLANDTLISHGPLCYDEHLLELDDFVWPPASIGWTMHYVPGLEGRPRIKYINQHVPSMIGFDVCATKCDDDLLFKKNRRA